MQSFDEIYKNYVNQVYKFLMCISRNENIAEELTQETFYLALIKINSFDGKCKMTVWLCQIAKNLYYNYYRKERNKQTFQLTHRILAKTNIEEDIILLQSSFNIHKILHSLEDPYKEVFTLRAFGDLSFKEISEIFDKNESWARVIYYRAKEKIKSIYNKMEGLE